MLTPLAALALLLSPPTDARESGLAPPEIGWGPEGAYGRIPLFWAADPGWDLTLSPGWGEAGAEGAGRLRWARGGEGEIEARLSGVDDLGWGGAWSARGQGRLRLGPARLGVDGAGAADPAAWGRGQRGAARLDDRLLMVAGLSLQGAQLGVGLRQHVEHDLRRDERAATPSLYLHLHTDDGGLSAQAEWVTARRPWLRTLIDGRRRLPLGPLTLRLDGGLLSLTDTDATGGRRAWAAGATGLGLAMGRRFGLYWHEWRVEISGAWSDGWRRGEIDWLTPASRGWAGIEAAQTLRGEALRLEISGRWMPWSWRAAEPGWVAGWAEGR
ncbi:hypothetical protein KKB55_09880, partial [Myxococcota bacterium]|nr:hypothetical protein [Myxococcota bacterium]MBU1898043.1 hypothetical protein [Myxococcota bacterium]